MAKLSICIPNYNMGNYIGETILSCLNQTEQDIEIIIVDNASSDCSWEIISDWAKRDSRIRPFRYNQIVRMPRNWNRCMEYVQGEKVIFLSADDMLKPNFAMACMDLFNLRPDLGYVCVERCLVNEKGDVKEVAPFYRSSGIISGGEEARINLIGGHAGPSQMLIRTSCLKQLDGYDERFDWAFDMYTKIRLCLHWDVGYIQDPLCMYRVHSGASTSRMKTSKLGIMEIYRLKMEIINSLPPNHYALSNCIDEMLRKLACLCLRFGEDIYAEGEIAIAAQYLCLAQSFWAGIAKEQAFVKLSQECDLHVYDLSPDGSKQLSKGDLSTVPPYPLPEGSISFP